MRMRVSCSWRMIEGMAKESLWLFFLLFVTTWTCEPAIATDGFCDDACQRPQCTKLEICQNKTSNETTTLLPVMAFFPCDVPEFRARGLTVAAQMAVNEIEKNSTVLQGYRIKLAVSITKCDRLTAVRAFINQLSAGVRYMIIGPGCSTEATPIAEISPFWNITQISYTATSISLSDKSRYPNFLRTITSDFGAVVAYTALVRQYQWYEVAIINQNDELFMNLTAVIAEELSAKGVNVITENLDFLPQRDVNLTNVVEALNMSGARVVILNTYENIASEIICNAYRRGMTYPHYTFLSPFWSSEGWWREEYNRTACEVCSSEELAMMLGHSIAIDYFPEPTPIESSLPTDVGLTPDEFWKEYVNNINCLGYEEEAIGLGRYTYDAVWAAALALDRTAKRLDSGAIPGKTLADYNYNESEINDMILNETRSLKFRGVSGSIQINESGDRGPFYIRFFQYRYSGGDVNATQIAFLDPSSNKFMYVDGEDEETVFPDGVTETARFYTIHPALFSFYTILACVGIIFAVVCIIFNLVFSKKRIVKLSSPYLNVVLCVGAILLYILVILLGMDQNIISRSAVDAVCQATVWFGGIGFALFFGTMLVKVFRVYYIFRNVRIHKSALKDWKLFLIVAAIVGIEVAFLIVVTFVPGWRLGLEYRNTEQVGGTGNGELPLLIPYCDSSPSTYWLPVYIGLNGLLLLVGLFFAIETFNVRIRELNDSLLVMISVVSFAMFSILLVTVGFLEIDENASYAVIGFVKLALITEVLAVQFLTKMVSLYRNRSGKVDISYAAADFYQTEFSHSSEGDKISELQSEIRNLKEQIQEKKQTLEQSSAGPETLMEEEISEEQSMNSRRAAESLNTTCSMSTTNEENRKESIKLLEDISEVIIPEDHHTVHYVT